MTTTIIAPNGNTGIVPPFIPGSKIPSPSAPLPKPPRERFDPTTTTRRSASALPGERTAKGQVNTGRHATKGFARVINTTWQVGKRMRGE